ncbi:unnamed protein product [Phytomonas sp. Hart1]|nr:unnamed protein product [Phytomonas sp. Hart1]|eukprot:CCW68965.1 unnamed protein product [Phytomonas sp. isolate Hart1]
MNSTCLGINGFNKLGRAILTASFLDPTITVTAINDPFFNIDFMCYLLRHECPHIGNLTSEGGEYLVINDTHKILITNAHECSSMSWGQQHVDVVVECSRVYTTRDRCWAHLAVGAPTVVIAAQSVDAALVHIMVNEDMLDKKLPVICGGDLIGAVMAPFVDILLRYAGIDEIVYTAIHGSLPLDSGGGRSLAFSEWCQARYTAFASDSITSYRHEGAYTLNKLFPQLKGKISGNAYQVSTHQGCMVDIYAHSTKIPFLDKSELNEVLLKAIKQDKYKNFIDSSAPNEALLSADCVGHHEIIYEQESLSCMPTSSTYRMRLWMDLERCYAIDLIEMIKRISEAKNINNIN